MPRAQVLCTGLFERTCGWAHEQGRSGCFAFLPRDSASARCPLWNLFHQPFEKDLSRLHACMPTFGVGGVARLAAVQYASIRVCVCHHGPSLVGVEIRKLSTKSSSHASAHAHSLHEHSLHTWPSMPLIPDSSSARANTITHALDPFVCVSQALRPVSRDAPSSPVARPVPFHRALHLSSRPARSLSRAPLPRA